MVECVAGGVHNAAGRCPGSGSGQLGQILTWMLQPPGPPLAQMLADGL